MTISEQREYLLSEAEYILVIVQPKARCRPDIQYR